MDHLVIRESEGFAELKRVR